MPGAARQVTAGVQQTGRPVSGPYKKRTAFVYAVGAGVLTRPSGFRQVDVGAAHRAARERPDEGIGPYEKNAAIPRIRRFPEPHLSPPQQRRCQKGNAKPLNSDYIGRRRRPPTQSPTEWVCVGEEEQGSGRSFRRQAETETSGLCDDEAAAKDEGEAFD